MNRARFDPLAYRDPRPSPKLIAALGPINRHLILPRLLKIRGLDLPAEDLARLRQVLRPGAAAFLGPNHPEFMTDWMIDKEISDQVDPLMAHWASREIVNLNPWIQWFWLRNNLIANVPDGGGKDYAAQWALAGHGVLLHPEGTATWHGDHIGPLVPGIVDLAWETCRHAARLAPIPVHVVPMVWKLHFTGDVSAGLHREMGVIEQQLGVTGGRDLTLEKRFEALQWSILLRRRERFGFAGPVGGTALPPHDFFEAQSTFASRLMEILEDKYGAREGDPCRKIHALRRAIRERGQDDPKTAREDRRKLRELERLHRFTREVYGHPTLTQEQIAENLKQIRSALLTRGVGQALHNLAPVAVAPRIAHVRVPEPIAVHEAFARGGDEAGSKAALLQTLRERLQAGLDDLNAMIAPQVQRFRRPNPFCTGPR